MTNYIDLNRILEGGFHGNPSVASLSTILDVLQCHGRHLTSGILVQTRCLIASMDSHSHILLTKTSEVFLEEWEIKPVDAGYREGNKWKTIRRITVGDNDIGFHIIPKVWGTTRHPTMKFYYLQISGDHT